MRRQAQRKRNAAETTARMEFFHDYYRENFPDMSDSEINLLVDNTEREHRDMKNELNTGADYTQFVPDPAQVSKVLGEYNELTTLGISQDIQLRPNLMERMPDPDLSILFRESPGADLGFEASDDAMLEDNFVEPSFDPFVPTEGEQDVLPGQSRVENPVSY